MRQILVSRKLNFENIKPTWASFKQLYVLFWITSFTGHYLEVIWARTLHVFFGYSVWHPSAPTIMPLAPPYGLGAVAVILLIWPLIKRYKLNPVGSFVLSVFVTGLVEYLCAFCLVVVSGHNEYWDYTGRFLNINGYVCLQSSLIFGLVSICFLYFVYPYYEKFIKRFDEKHFNAIFWVLFVSYAIDLIFINIK